MITPQETLEGIKDSISGDRLAEIGFYDNEPFITKACDKHDKLVKGLKKLFSTVDWSSMSEEVFQVHNEIEKLIKEVE